MGLLSHKIVLFLIVQGTSILFSIVVAPICIPPTMHEGSLFSTSWTTLVFVDLLMIAIDSCEVQSHCGFDL